MKQNKYDDENLFAAYGQMSRSVKGLEGTGEWYEFNPLIPILKGKNVLDLGWRFGWHCRYAHEQQANSVIGIDISKKCWRKHEKKRMILPYHIYICQLKILNFRHHNLML